MAKINKEMIARILSHVGGAANVAQAGNCMTRLRLTLRDEGYISDTGDAEPEETLKVYRMLADLITSDVRLTIESVTQDDA